MLDAVEESMQRNSEVQKYRNSLLCESVWAASTSVKPWSDIIVQKTSNVNGEHEAYEISSV